jgi:hypothetical protein
MTKLSDSTKLINKIIYLTRINPEDSSQNLYIKGYNLEYLEPFFLNSKGDIINPDIQVFSVVDNNLVFFECKCGSFDHNQALKYKELKKDEIVSSGITHMDMSTSNFEIIYLCDEKSKSKLIEGDNINNYNFPIVSYENDKFVLQKNDIKGKILNEVFTKGLSVLTNSPVSFYPFGPDDDLSYISIFVLQSILHFALSKYEFSCEDILRDCHPCYDNIHKKGQDKLKEKVGRILTELDQKDFKEEIKFIKSTHKYLITSKALIKFRNLCQKKINEYENTKSVTLLTDFKK